MKCPRLVFAAAVIAMASVGFDQPTQAQEEARILMAQSAAAENTAITPKSDAKRKINLSGRQRMLSQYMAKAACFASLGVDETAQVNEMRLAHHLFDITLSDFRDGSKVQQIFPERDSTILTGLTVVERLWRSYGQAVENREIATIFKENMMVLTKMNEAVTLFQAKYGSKGDVAPEIAAALNISGRQRMLTQKSSKELCLIAAGKDEAANRASLKASVALFEASMLGLKDGNSAMGLQPAPHPDILAQIGRVNEAWTPMRVIFAKVADGAKPTMEEVTAVARQNVAVMQAANAIVELYEQRTK